VSLHSVQIGLAFLHLAVTSQIPQVRRAVIKALEVGVANQPQIVNRIVRESLAGSLVRDKLSTSKTLVTLGEQPEVSLRGQARLSAFLFSVAAIGEDVDRSIRENLMTELIVLGHHPAICRPPVYHPTTAQLIFWRGSPSGGSSRQTWIELCQKAGTDPHNLVNKNINKLFEIILAASVADPTVSSMCHASTSVLSMIF